MSALPLFLLLSSICLTATAATIPTSNPAENVVTCRSGAGCYTQNIDGRSYKIMKLPGIVLMVSVSSRGDYTRADVSIMNKTNEHLKVLPSNFRIEVLTPNPQTVVSLSPESDSATFTDTPTPTRHSSRVPPPVQVDFADNLLAPNEGTQGRLLFASGKKSHLMKVVLPLGGVWYEFPYTTQQ